MVLIPLQVQKEAVYFLWRPRTPRLWSWRAARAHQFFRIYSQLFSSSSSMMLSDVRSLFLLTKLDLDVVRPYLLPELETDELSEDVPPFLSLSKARVFDLITAAKIDFVAYCYIPVGPAPDASSFSWLAASSSAFYSSSSCSRISSRSFSRRLSRLRFLNTRYV